MEAAEKADIVGDTAAEERATETKKKKKKKQSSIIRDTNSSDRDPIVVDLRRRAVLEGMTRESHNYIILMWMFYWTLYYIYHKDRAMIMCFLIFYYM